MNLVMMNSELIYLKCNMISNIIITTWDRLMLSILTKTICFKKEGFCLQTIPLEIAIWNMLGIKPQQESTTLDTRLLLQTPLASMRKI